MSLNKAVIKWEWCAREGRFVDWIGWAKDAPKGPKRVRCEVCRQRFITPIKECHDSGCLHTYLPAHKRKIKVVK